MSSTPVARYARSLKRLLLLLLSATLLVLVTSPEASAATPTIRQRSLTVSVSGGVVSATTTVTSSKSVKVAGLAVCVRSATGVSYDLPARSAVRLKRSAKAYTFTGRAAVPAGDYRVGTCVKVKKTWQALQGWQAVTVPAASSTPSAAPSPSPATGPLPTGVGGSWTLALDQSFGAKALDRSVWRPSRWEGDGDQTPFNPAIEDAQFNARNVATDSEAVTLSTSRADTASGGRSYRYRSGTISTEGTFALRDNSFVEARIRIPKGDGLWPAFWAVPSGEWPPEIDIFEFFDTATDSRPFFNYHYRDGSGQAQQTGPHRYGDPKVDYRSGWHTYGLQRTGGRLVPWLDGTAYPEAATPGPGDKPMFLILNLSVKRGASAPTGASMDIEHVRAWTGSAA